MQPRQFHLLSTHRLVDGALELAFLVQPYSVSQRLHTQYLGRLGGSLPSFDQAHRLQLEFQRVLATRRSVFSLAHFFLSS